MRWYFFLDLINFSYDQVLEDITLLPFLIYIIEYFLINYYLILITRLTI